MMRLRFGCMALLAWFFVLYNIERLHEPINLASFIYVLTAMSGLLVLSVPRLQRISLFWLLTLPVPVVLLLKLWFGYHVTGTHLPLTLTEVGAVQLSMFLALQITKGAEEFRSTLAGTLVRHLHDRSHPFEKGQGEIYREIRRARRYHRPLALLAVSPKDGAVKVSLDRFIREFQRDTVDKYITARVAEFLSSAMKDCDIITHRNGHFIMLLPETDREKAKEVVASLEAAARESLGLDLKFGLSVFPEEEVTFVSLLERAESHLHNGSGQEAKAQGNGHATKGEPHQNLGVVPTEQQVSTVH